MFFGQVFSLAANLGVTVLLARQLGQAGFGLFSYAVVNVGLFAIIADFGMQAILVRELSRSRWTRTEILGAAVTIKALLAIITIALAIVVSWKTVSSPALFQIIVIIALSILISPKFAVFRIVFESPFHATLWMQVPMLLQLLDSVLMLGVMYLLVQSGAGLKTMVIAYSLSNLPGFLLIVYACAKNFPFRPAINRDLIGYLLRQSFSLFLYLLFMTLFGSVDVLLLEKMQGEASVGIYAAAMRLASPLLFIPNAIVSSLLPVLSKYHESSNENFTKAFHLGLKMLFLVAIALAIATTFLGSQVIHLLYSSEYGESAGPLIILMWGQVFLFLNFYFANVLTSANQQRITFFAAATMFATNFLANWLFIPLLGISGAAFAKLTSSAFGLMVLLIAINRIFTLDLNRFLFRGALVAVAFAGGLSLLSWVPLGISIIVSSGIFILLVTISGVFNNEERTLFKSMIPTAMSRK